MFSSLSGVRLVFWMLLYLNILCIRQTILHWKYPLTEASHSIITHSSLKIDNHHWLLTSVGQQQYNMSTVYPKHHRHAFSSWSGSPSIASDLSDPAVNRMRFRLSTSLQSWRYNFDCKALQSKELTELRPELLGKFFVLPWTPVHTKQVTGVRWIVVLSIP